MSQLRCMNHNFCENGPKTATLAGKNTILMFDKKNPVVSSEKISNVEKIRYLLQLVIFWIFDIIRL